MRLLATLLTLLPATYVLADQGTTVDLESTTIGDGQTIDLNSLATASATSSSSSGGVAPLITAAPMALAGMVGWGVLQNVL
ncbi:hypothetical protein H2200_012732 [Cladophialophora chaetospira]|uniref:Uncharacterized protein n=1 Tax=Cladophialophora chaetospira TaxID=386627 RepID=A0AA38WXJ9_9EURO|nr:hypothetical protein H2200_012732 [Cladophialophora chaetospira]